MTSAIKMQVIEKLDRLPESSQQQVLAFVETLQIARPRGIPGKQLLSFAGTISMDDLRMMQEAIEKDCEQVNLDEW